VTEELHRIRGEHKLCNISETMSAIVLPFLHKVCLERHLKPNADTSWVTPVLSDDVKNALFYIGGFCPAPQAQPGVERGYADLERGAWDIIDCTK